MNKKIIIISGPTASGKTDLSIKIAKEYKCEIVNFDSLLFYKELNIGTAKPTNDERLQAPHHLIDIVSAKKPIHAAEFVKLAIPTIDRIHTQGKVPILVGGSGFYLQALINGMYESNTTPISITNRSDVLYEEEGILPFVSILKENDEESFQSLHENDHYRVRRAVEHFWTTGKKFSQARLEMDKERELTWQKKNWSLLHLYMDIPKDEHLEYIYSRTNIMLKNGLVKEVQNLLNTGFTGEEKPLQSIGYKQVVSFLKGELIEQEVQERIDIATRRLAKSQRTWFKTKEKLNFHPIKDEEIINNKIKLFLI